MTLRLSLIAIPYRMKIFCRWSTKSQSFFIKFVADWGFFFVLTQQNEAEKKKNGKDKSKENNPRD